MKYTYDVIVIGSGPGGAMAARVLAAGGKKTALVESDSLGGTCLNHGCIPTKFLLAATAPVGLLQDHKRFGSLNGDLDVAFEALQKRKDRFIKGSSQALGKSLLAEGAVIFNGVARITGPGKVSIQGDSPAELAADVIILATGSHSASFPGLEPDGEAVLDSTMLLALSAVPKSLIIVGAGAIGVEFSDFFNAMGTEVTVVEGMPQLVPLEDSDIGEELRKIMSKTGRTCITGKKVRGLTTKDGLAELTFDDGTMLHAEKALLAVGRKANVQALNAEATGASLTQKGFVAVNEYLEAAPGCYAIGDINGKTLLAHAAEHQGDWVARRLLGQEQEPYDDGPVPSCIFGHIEIMRVGKTAREIAAAGGRAMVSKAPFSANPIAQAHASTAGFAKAVWDGDTLKGMAAIGHGASHLVTAAQLLVLDGHGPGSLHRFMFAHPTLDEVLKTAILAPRTPHLEP